MVVAPELAGMSDRTDRALPERRLAHSDRDELGQRSARSTTLERGTLLTALNIDRYKDKYHGTKKEPNGGGKETNPTT